MPLIGSFCRPRVQERGYAGGPIPSVEAAMSTSPSEDTVRLAALADIHYSKSAPTSLQPLFMQIAEAADVLVLCGDLTDYGLADEARLLAKDLAQVKVPIVGVLGN